MNKNETEKITLLFENSEDFRAFTSLQAYTKAQITDAFGHVEAVDLSAITVGDWKSKTSAVMLFAKTTSDESNIKATFKDSPTIQRAYPLYASDIAKEKEGLSFSDIVNSLNISRCPNDEEVFNFTADLISAIEKTKKIGAYKNIAKAMNETPPEELRFLWNPYLRDHTINLLFAPGGTGKTSLTILIAATIAKGRYLPNDYGNGEIKAGIPLKSLFLTAEETAGELRRKFNDCGVNNDEMKMISAYSLIDAKKNMSFKDKNDLFFLQRLIEAENARLTVIDPISAFLGSINANSIAELRPILQNLTMVAKNTRSTIILVTHTNKRMGADSLVNTALGSVDFVNASRSALTVITDKEDPSHKILVHAKSNGAPLGVSINYCFENDRCRWGTPESETDIVAELTKETWEDALLQKKNPFDLLKLKKMNETTDRELCAFVEKKLEESPEAKTKIYIKELKQYTDSARPKTVLKKLLPYFSTRGIAIDLSDHNDGAQLGWYVIARKI